MQASAATAAAVNEAVAMESSDSDSSTEDDDAQPNNGRARLRKTSFSHVLLVASICGAFSCGRQAKVHRERMIWGSPAALKARAAHFVQQPSKLGLHISDSGSTHSCAFSRK